jgi:hypothetical protein
MVIAVVLAAANLASRGSATLADELPTAKATIPDNFVEIRKGLGGAYYVDARIKKRYDALVAEVRALQADVQEARISEADARARIEQMQKEVRAALAQIEENEVFVAPATIHTKRESEKFELGPEGVLLVKAHEVQITGWDKPHVEVRVEKIVLSADKEPVAAELDAIKVIHRRMTGAEALERGNRQQRAEALMKLTEEQWPKQREYLLSMFRCYARLDPETLAKLPSAVADDLRPRENMPTLLRMAERWPFEEFYDSQIDVVELDGLSYQSGNRQMTLEIRGESGGSVSSVWSRHARLTLYVPKCRLVGVQGGHAGIELAGIDAAVEVKMEDVPGRDSTFRVKDVKGSLLARDVPWQLVENVAGDVRVMHTKDVGIQSTNYGDARAQLSARAEEPLVYRAIGGRLIGWFVQANLEIEGVGKQVDLRNDFGDTVWTLDKPPSAQTNRIIAEAGDIQLRIPTALTVAAPITAVSEVGDVYAPDAMQQLDGAMFSTPGADGVTYSWHGFFSKVEGKDDVLAKFERYRRVAKIVADEERGPGLDLVSGAGTVRILIVPAK